MRTIRWVDLSNTDYVKRGKIKTASNDELEDIILNMRGYREIAFALFELLKRTRDGKYSNFAVLEKQYKEGVKK